MYKIHVSAKMRSNSATCEEKFHREYLSDGTLLETKEIIYENDYCNGTYKRLSPIYISIIPHHRQNINDF